MTLVNEFKKENCLFRILPSRTNKHRGEDVSTDDYLISKLILKLLLMQVLPEDRIKLESVSDKGHHILCALNSLSSRYSRGNIHT